jgi:GT2 family glycosyltransferase
MSGATGIHVAAAPAALDPHVTVVIATCSHAARVLRCLRSLLASDYASWDVIVAENRPAYSNVRAALAQEFPGEQRITVIDVPVPGLSRVRNAGLGAAGGELVAFIDDDIVVSPDWLSATVRGFQTTDAACVTGRISAASLASVEESWFEQLAALEKGDQPILFRLDAAARATNPLFPYSAGAIGSGASIAVRTDTARALGGFDPTLGAGTPTSGGEDLDFFVRLLQQGHSIFYEPAATVSHEHPTDRGAVKLRAFRYGLGLTAMLTAQFVRGPRRPLLRAIPAGLRYLRDPGSRKNASRASDYPAHLHWLEWLGFALGPVAWLRTVLSERPPGVHRFGDAAVKARREVFVPTIARAVDLERPLEEIGTPRSSRGQVYGQLLALVRLHGDPLSTVTIPLRDGSIEAGDLGDAVWTQAAHEVYRHVEIHGCLAVGELSREGLTGGLGGQCTELVPERAHAPFVTVIVPTAGRPERVAPCVESLSALDYPHFEIVIVDNSPADGRTREQVQACVSRGLPVRYAAESLPGSSVARNRGMRESRAEILAFTDDDVAVDPDWLSWLVKPFLGAPDVGVVTGLVMPVRYDTPEQQRFEEQSGFGKGFERHRFDRTGHERHERLLYPYWGAAFGSGNSMAFRRAVLEEMGGLDPALGAGSLARAGADIESFSHAVLNGHSLVYEPRAVCWHDHRTSRDALLRQTFNYGVGCTAILTKWVLRDPRLVGLAVGQILAIGRGRLAGGATGVPYELTRLRRQVDVSDRGQMTLRQFGGFALGPFMYARSVLWSRRLGLRDVFPARGAGRSPGAEGEKE